MTAEASCRLSHVASLAFLVLLFGLTCAAGVVPVLNLITPLQNVQPQQLLGRWYAVEQVRNFSLQPEELCITFDFFLSDDNRSVLVNQTLTRQGDAFNLPTQPVGANSSWAYNSYGVLMTVLDLSLDGHWLSLASCNTLASSCYGVVLSRDYNLTDYHSELLEVHRGMTRAGLLDTKWGHRQHPDACRPGVTLPFPREPLQPEQYQI